jgi:hypothetical protein
MRLLEGRPIGDRLGIEDDQIRRPADGDRTAVLQADDAGR